MIGLEELVSEWFNHARDDLRSAEHLTTLHPVPCEVICYLCRQSAEKALKGFLVFHIPDQEPPRIHDLEQLRKMCSEWEKDFALYEVDCKRLTQYAVAARYPNELEIDLKDAELALKSAAAVLKFVEGHIK